MQNVLLKTYPKLKIQIVDTGLVYREETFAKCKICEKMKKVFLAGIEIAVNNKTLMKGFFPCCNDCFYHLHGIFKKLEGIDVEIGHNKLNFDVIPVEGDEP